MNVLDATTRIVYAVAMALVFGGTAALSFASAPATFRLLRPLEAGRVFGRTLRAFDAMAFWVTVLAVASSALDATFGAGAPAVIRTVLAVTVAALLLLARKGLTPRMAALKPPESEEEDRRWDAANRAAFGRLHGQYVRVYSANLFLSLAALAIHAIAR